LSTSGGLFSSMTNDKSQMENEKSSVLRARQLWSESFLRVSHLPYFILLAVSLSTGGGLFSPMTNDKSQMENEKSSGWSLCSGGEDGLASCIARSVLDATIQLKLCHNQARITSPARLTFQLAFVISRLPFSSLRCERAIP
ncbi:MAG TPA: hypothetical protein VGL29_19575, partial [Blastocatellia bacterium]